MRPHEDIEQAMDAHGSTVWRVCVLYFRASADAQDAFQDTMVKYALADTVSFNDDEHRKAWLIRVAANTCKDMPKEMCIRDSLDTPRSRKPLLR